MPRGGRQNSLLLRSCHPLPGMLKTPKAIMVPYPSWCSRQFKMLLLISSTKIHYSGCSGIDLWHCSCLLHIQYFYSTLIEDIIFVILPSLLILAIYNLAFKSNLHKASVHHNCSPSHIPIPEIGKSKTAMEQMRKTEREASDATDILAHHSHSSTILCLSHHYPLPL